MSQELKNKAIVIRDEVNEGANTAERVGSWMVGANDEIDKAAQTIQNVSQISGNYSYPDKQTARNSVLIDKRERMQLLSYRLETGEVITEQYNSTSIGNWNNEAAWTNIAYSNYTIIDNYAIVGSNTKGIDSFLIHKNDEKDTITLKGSWFILRGSPTSIYGTQNLFFTKTDSRTFEIPLGFGLFVSKKELNKLATGGIIPNTAFYTRQYYGEMWKQDDLLVYATWLDNNYGMLAHAINQKIEKINNEAFLGSYFVPDRIKGNIPIYDIDSITWGDNFISELTFSDGYIDRSGIVSTSITGYKHSNPFKLTKRFLKIVFASSVTYALYDKYGKFISTIGASNIYDWMIYIQTDVVYVILNIQDKFLPGGSESATHPAYIQQGDTINMFFEAPNIVIKNSNKNLLGKKWASLGDSITFQQKWQTYLVEKYILKHTNCGIGSTCLAGNRTNSFWMRLQPVKDANPDIVTILGGANDLAYDIPIGTESDILSKNTDTFLGAYSYIVDDLLSWKPSLRIVILTTTWAHNNGDSLTHSSGLQYTDYANASKQIANYFGLPIADLHNECGFNKYTKNIYFPDGIHPNDEGGKRIAEIVNKQMEYIFKI